MIKYSALSCLDTVGSKFIFIPTTCRIFIMQSKHKITKWCHLVDQNIHTVEPDKAVIQVTEKQKLPKSRCEEELTGAGEPPVWNKSDQGG